MTGQVFSIVSDFGLGLLLGGIGGIFGIGGGLIAIPTLIWLFGMDQQLAQGTALIMIAPNVLLGFLRYRQRNPIEMKSVFILGLTSICSTYIAAKYAAGLDSHSLHVAFAWFLIALTIFLLFELRPGKVKAKSTLLLHQRWLSLVGLISGICSGLFTVGGGLVVAPAVIHFFGIKRQTTAQGLALATVVPGAVVALLIYSAAGKVDWLTGIPMAAGSLISLSWGVGLAHYLPETHLRILFCLLLCGTAWTLF